MKPTKQQKRQAKAIESEQKREFKAEHKAAKRQYKYERAVAGPPAMPTTTGMYSQAPTGFTPAPQQQQQHFPSAATRDFIDEQDIYGDEDDECHNDDQCEYYDDCCDDFDQYQDDDECQDDEYCEEYGDCCYDDEEDDNQETELDFGQHYQSQPQ